MALVTIRILDGADRGRLYPDVPTPVTIGREEGNDIQLAVPVQSERAATAFMPVAK